MKINETPMPPYPWQHDIWQRFCESVSKQRVPHALLISGVEGVGVSELAEAMGRYLLCVSPLEDVACGRCRGCQLISSGTHPDLFVLKREEDATQIKVDQVRSCVEFVAKTSFAEGPKVVLVEHADTMNVNAANALLKSLEEPQGQTVFLLTSNRLSTILPTIRSRCRGITVAVPSRQVSADWFADQGREIDYAVLEQAGGAPILAKNWLEGSYLDKHAKVLDAITQLMTFRSGAVIVANGWQASDLELNLHIQIQILEQAIKNKLGAKRSNSHSELFDILQQIAELYLFRLRDKLLLKLGQVRSRANLNPQMIGEELAMDWAALAQLAGR